MKWSERSSIAVLLVIAIFFLILVHLTAVIFVFTDTALVIFMVTVNELAQT